MARILTKTELLLFGPFTMFLEICLLIYFVGFASSLQITSKKYAKTISFAQVIKFCKITRSRGVNPNPPCVRPCCALLNSPSENENTILAVAILRRGPGWTKTPRFLVGSHNFS